MAQEIDLLKNSSFETKMDELIEAVSSGGGGSTKVEVFTLDLKNEWVNNELTVYDERLISSGYIYMIAPVELSLSEYKDFGISAKDVTTDGQITFRAEKLPANSFTVNVIKMEVA